MGGKLGIINDYGRRVGPVDLDAREYGMLKKMWTEIEDNPQNYSRGIYMRFFALYPQYAKYFVDEDSAPYEKFHRINEKFIRILSTIGFLVRDFYKKPKKFDGIVSYIAVVHQDMQLGVDDLKNFSHAIVEYLRDVVPHVMTDECVMIFTDFMDDLAHQLVARMVKGRAEVAECLENRDRGYHPCRWLRWREKVIYGHELSYWASRKTEWEAKIEKWRKSPADNGTLYNLFSGSEGGTDDEKRRSSAPFTRFTYPRIQGSVISEILQEKILRAVTEFDSRYFL